ncbi:MAG: ABC transporter ATP-binding protein [Acidobacteria bacterium]|nr:ABC transporter ATP-binding protein [Acidobacteriota bacterium]
MTPISVRGLRKSYGTFEAVRGVDFEVRVLGLDPGLATQAIKDRIGVCLQSTNLPEKIRVHEAVSLFASFYSRHTDSRRLLERLQLWQKRNDFYVHLSGGQKQRVALALALINDPELLFLDEPTSGLDPQVRLEIHGLIEELRDAGRTILLTTHYIEEAERLCSRVAIVDQGRIIACGTPRELQEKTLGHSRIEIVCEKPLPVVEIPLFEGAERSVLSDDRLRMTVHSGRPARTVVDLVKWIDQQGVGLSDIHLNRPTLEDVFLELTGRKLRE